MRILLFLFLIISVLAAVAQDQTLGQPGEPYRKKARILVIPNDYVMYRSNLDMELAVANNLNPMDVREFVRKDMGFEIAAAAATNNSTIFLDPSVRLHVEDLKMIYASVGYKGEELEQGQSRNGQREQKGTLITRGELTVAPQHEEKFMRTTLSNPELINTLYQDFGAEYYIFIGQIDLLMAPGTTQESIQRSRYQRIVRAHYTIYHRDGTTVAAGTASCEFPSQMTMLGNIRDKCFPALAQQVVSGIPVPLLESTPEQ